MADRKPPQGRRRAPAIEAIHQAQLGGEQNALAALRRYRQQGGSIRTQEWYRMWRLQRQLGPAVRQPDLRKHPRKPGQAGQWTTNVGVVYLDPDSGDTVTLWHRIQSPRGRKRISDTEALRQAMDQGWPKLRRRKTMVGYQPVFAYVTSYEYQ